MLNLADRNPVAVRAAIVALATAIVHVVAVMGLIDADLEQAIGPVIDGIGLVILVVWARAGVTPNAKVISRVTTKGTVVAGDAAVVPTGRELALRSPLHGNPVLADVTVNPELVNH